MNREPDYRIWNKKTKEMINDVHICPEYGFLVMSDNDALSEMLGRINPKDLVWMQSTGLRDKNGKTIYEGDVVKNVLILENNTFIENIDVVEFNKEECSFMLTSGVRHFNKNLELEVLGNIFE